MGAGRSTWATLIQRHGRTAELIRLGTPDVSVSVKMMRRYAEEDKLEHEVSQQDAWFVVEYTELVAAGFPLDSSSNPTPKKNDRVKLDNQYFTVQLCEPKTSHGELVGYQLRCLGG